MRHPTDHDNRKHFGRDRSIFTGLVLAGRLSIAHECPIRLAEIGGIIGDPARAVMLCVLLNGRGHSATELSLAAGVSPQTASWHLAKFADGKLITAEKRGRNRNFRLASPLVTGVRAQGQVVDKNLLAHLSPLGWEHINLTGDYVWHSKKRDGQGPNSTPCEVQKIQ
jgi:DNA-binding transcriptional ArsR family regulator